MNTLKKTIAVLLVVSLAALTACSDDGEKKRDNNVNNVNNVNNLTDKDTGNTENDTDDNQSDADNQTDADDKTDTDDNTDADDKTDADDTEDTELDGELLLKDLTVEQANSLCAYKFEQMEPTYNPAVPAGEGNCFYWAVDDSYMSENSQKVADCQASFDACMAVDYKPEDIDTDGCMDEAVRAKCEVTVEEYRVCANDRAAASIAHNELMLSKTCADLGTNSGRNAVDELLFAYEHPASCDVVDTKCERLD